MKASVLGVNRRFQTKIGSEKNQTQSIFLPFDWQLKSKADLPQGNQNDNVN